MAEASAISWCDSTFNPWIGCQKVSAACDNCYAEAWAARFKRAEWGPEAARVRTSRSTWAQPLKWQREADAFEAEHGRPRFVFCASLADVFDNAVDPAWREDLWALIGECDRLIWLLLTKRSQNMAKMLPEDWGAGLPHVWLGTTVENQEAADRNIPHLLGTQAAKRFVSVEPMIDQVNLTHIPNGRPIVYPSGQADGNWYSALAGRGHPKTDATLDWVIASGESGPGARPSHPDWFRRLRDDCAAAGVPFHFKQWGEWVPWQFENDPVMLAQDGRIGDRADMPDFKDLDAMGTRWSEALIYEGAEGVLCERVGKRIAGRRLDGVIHDARPEATI